MDIDARLDRLVERHEVLTREMARLRTVIDSLRILAQQDGEYIRALLRTAEMRGQA